MQPWYTFQIAFLALAGAPGKCKNMPVGKPAGSTAYTKPQASGTRCLINPACTALELLQTLFRAAVTAVLVWKLWSHALQCRGISIALKHVLKVAVLYDA